MIENKSQFKWFELLNEHWLSHVWIYLGNLARSKNQEFNNSKHDFWKHDRHNNRQKIKILKRTDRKLSKQLAVVKFWISVRSFDSTYFFLNWRRRFSRVIDLLILQQNRFFVKWFYSINLANDSIKIRLSNSLFVYFCSDVG